MKNSFRIPLALLSVCTVLPVSGLRAQAPAAAPLTTATPSVSAPAKSAAAPDEENEGKMRMRALSVLTPEEQQKLRAANKAARQDPAVKALEPTRATDKKGYRQAVRAAMLRADPSIAPLLEKVRDARPHKKNF